MAKPQNISSLLSKNNISFLEKIEKQSKYVKHTFQSLGIELAERLNDVEHKAIYMRFAKKYNEGILRAALSYALDYPLKHGSRAKIFMWKLKQLKIESDDKIKKDN